MGSILDLTSDQWFGEFDPKLSVHVLDSLRPQNLSSLFDDSDEGRRVVVWDDGTADNMKPERTAFETLMVRTVCRLAENADTQYLARQAYPEDSDEDSDSDPEEEIEEPEDEDEDVLAADSDEEGSPTSSGKRRRSGGDRVSYELHFTLAIMLILSFAAVTARQEETHFG